MKEASKAKELRQLWKQLMHDCNDLTSYLLRYSNLPGPRANLTLAFTLGELFLESWSQNKVKLSYCLDKWAQSMDQYLLLCRNIVLGFILSEYDSDLFAEVLYNENFNPKWRPREAVTLGLQRTLDKRPDYVVKLLDKWNTSCEPIVLRNTLMILAEPKILQQKPELRDVLRDYIHESINFVKEKRLNKKEDIKLLRKSLHFVPSVAAMNDERILSDLSTWAGSECKDLKSIVKSNLKKKRFIKLYPEESKTLLRKL